MNTGPVVLIDLSSYIFYRFFAIHKWLAISGKDADFTSEMTLDKFSLLFQSNLKEIKKKLKVDWQNIYLVRDCPRERIWRLDVYPDYKKSRDEKRSPLFDPTIFVRAYNDIVPKMVKEFGLHVLSYDRAEADDVIAVFHNDIRLRNAQTKVYILSADSDFLQLDGNNTEVLNFKFKPLASTIKNQTVLEHYLLWKVIRGDSSDNIPAIDKKIGDVTAIKLASSSEALKSKLASSSAVRDSFERNRTLIDFQCIPDDLKNGILAMVAAEKK